MKKWLICLLVVVLAFSTLAVTAFADGGTPTVTVALDSGDKNITIGSAEKESGKDITLKFTVSGTQDIKALSFNVVYPDDVFTYKSKSGAESSWYAEGTKAFAVYDVNGKSYSELFTLTLTATNAAASETASYTFDVSNIKVEYADGSKPTGSSTPLTGVTVKHDTDAHNWSETVVTPPTCTEAGKIDYTCDCGATKQEVGDPATGHSWLKENVVWGKFDPQSPDTAVEVTVTCANENCDETLTTSVTPKKGEETPATCEKAGSTLYTGDVTFEATMDETSPNHGGLPITAKNEGNWSVEIPALGHKWEGIEDTVTWDTSTPGDYKASAKAKCGNANCDEKWNENAADCQVTVEPKETPATCEKDGSIVYTATVKSPDGTTTFDEPTGYQKTEVLTKLGHDWGDMVITEWDKTTSGAWKATKATITCSNEGCDFTNGATQTVTGTDLETSPTTVAPTYETAGSVTYKVTAKFKTDNAGSETLEKTDETMVEPLAKLKAPAPAAKVESAIVPSQSQGTTEGIITDAANDVIGKALAGTTVDKSVVDANVCEAIKNAGTSAKDGSLSVSTELVVNENAEPDAGVAAGVPAGATFLDIAIKVTVSSTDSTALPSNVEGYIHQVGTPIQFTVDKPKGGPIFYVARYHDGGWEKLETTVGETTLSFKSDKFSTFAVISSNDIADADITFTPQYAYTGAVIRPVVKVTVNGGAVELKEGTDYELTVAGDAVQPGDYKLTIKGIGSYTGSVEKTITILTPDATPTPAATAAPTATPVPTEAPATATPAPTAAGTAAPTATKDPNAAPQTGDETPVMLYATMLTVCAAALTLALIFRRRREK